MEPPRSVKEVVTAPVGRSIPGGTSPPHMNTPSTSSVGTSAVVDPPPSIDTPHDAEKPSGGLKNGRNLNADDDDLNLSLYETVRSEHEKGENFIEVEMSKGRRSSPLMADHVHPVSPSSDFTNENDTFGGDSQLDESIMESQEQNSPRHEHLLQYNSYTATEKNGTKQDNNVTMSPLSGFYSSLGINDDAFDVIRKNTIRST